MKLENHHQIITLEEVYLLQLKIWKRSVFLSYSSVLCHENISTKCKTNLSVTKYYQQSHSTSEVKWTVLQVLCLFHFLISQIPWVLCCM